jgi:hypothetical protein
MNDPEDSMRMNTPVGSVNYFITSTLILPVRASDDDEVQV